MLFPPDYQAGDTDVDDGKSNAEDDPDELRPEQDGDILPRRILLTNAELHRGMSLIAGLTDREYDTDSEAGESDDRNEHEAPKESRVRKRNFRLEETMWLGSETVLVCVEATLLFNNLNKNSMYNQKFSIDESMVQYFRFHFTKHFIKGKPIRNGYEI